MKNDDIFDLDDGIKPNRKAKVRRKKNRAGYFLTLLGCLVLLVIVMYAVLYFVTKFQEKEENDGSVPAMGQLSGENNIDGVQSGNNIYTQAQVDVLLTEERNTVGAQAAQNKEIEILETIKAKLAEGKSSVEALRSVYKDELVLVSGGQYHFVPIREDLKKNSFLNENLQILENGELQYLDGDQVVSHKGIDVSKHQGKIDWNLVAQDGVEFAILRIAYRGYGESGKLVEDEYYEQNVKGAINAGIKVGVYIYSQAINEAELLEEANLVLERIAPYKIEGPVVFDVEKVNNAQGRMNLITVEERTYLTKLFCDTIKGAGYKPMIYHNMEMSALMLDISQLEEYDKWFAYYNSDFYYPYDYKIWQYSDKGKVNGVKGEVDLNISFSPFWEE